MIHNISNISSNIIIFHNISNNNYPILRAQPSSLKPLLKRGFALFPLPGFPIEGGDTVIWRSFPPSLDLVPPPLRNFFPLRGLFTCLQ